MYSYDRRAEDSEYSQMEAILNKDLKRFPKDRQGAWWDPPHNYVVNSALMGLNGWIFTILPFRAAQTAYRPAKNGKPEGIVIDPAWNPDPKHEGTFPHTVKVAEIFVKVVKSQGSVEDTVRRELSAIESHFKVQIPSAVSSKLIGEADKVAARRWGVDRLRRKKILVPFDGSKPIQLGSFD